MKFWKLASAATALLLSTSVNAALIDNGSYTTDTVSSLDWIDLSITDTNPYNLAPSLNSGWRHATNNEVANLFGILFDGYYDTEGNGSSYIANGAYADQTTDVSNFISLFGSTYEATDQSLILSIGMYLDENNVLRAMGVNTSSYVFGIDLNSDMSPYLDTSHQNVGVFMVRTSVVPVPSAVWLFGSGLIGLAGFGRRKKV